jgi:hypothetical protein
VTNSKPQSLETASWSVERPAPKGAALLSYTSPDESPESEFSPGDRKGNGEMPSPFPAVVLSVASGRIFGSTPPE